MADSSNGQSTDALLLAEEGRAEGRWREIVREIRLHAEKKQWHQFAVSLAEYIKGCPSYSLEATDTLPDGRRALELLNGVVYPLRAKLSPLRFALIFYGLSRTAGEKLFDSAQLSQLIEETGKKCRDAATLLMCLEAHHSLARGEATTARDLLEKVQKRVDLDETDTDVLSAYYRIWADVAQERGDLDDHVASSLLWLAYTPINSLSTGQMRKEALRILRNAIAAKHFFNFGELTTQPILNALEGTEDAWALTLMDCFAKGDLVAYASLQKTSATVLKGLKLDAEELQGKLQLLALLRLAFSYPGAERSLSFQHIGDRCSVACDKVERLVMRAMAAGLLRGHIDETNAIVHVQWLKPQLLAEDRIREVQTKVLDWARRAEDLTRATEVSTSALLAA